MQCNIYLQNLQNTLHMSNKISNFKFNDIFLKIFSLHFSFFFLLCNKIFQSKKILINFIICEEMKLKEKNVDFMESFKIDYFFSKKKKIKLVSNEGKNC